MTPTKETTMTSTDRIYTARIVSTDAGTEGAIWWTANDGEDFGQTAARPIKSFDDMARFANVEGFAISGPWNPIVDSDGIILEAAVLDTMVKN